MPVRLADRAEIVLPAADGPKNREFALAPGITRKKARSQKGVSPGNKI